MGRTAILSLLCTAVLGVCLAVGLLDAAEKPSSWKSADKLYNDGNYREALRAYRKLLKSETASSTELISGYQRAQQCIQQLNQLAELDEFRESVVERHAQNWRVLATVAQSYLHMPHYGYQIAGEFRRGRHRGGGKVMNALARDRVRALQLHWQAFQLIQARNTAPGAQEAEWLSQQFAYAVMHGNAYHQTWRFQALTDLAELPDYEEGWGDHGYQTQGAPVDADGEPIFYEIPDSWQAAKNDGQRWRWLLNQAVAWHPQDKNRVETIRAKFLQSQFGAETLAQYGWWFGRGAIQDDKAETGAFALHTLAENETIARLATGIKRFELPAEHNPIKIYQEL
ncbi:MAG: alpha-2-macroglobulin, partial [Pirellulales bacterium]|nr:alpha-2-macroglobulin [Pirellulales bacterium]